MRVVVDLRWFLVPLLLSGLALQGSVAFAWQVRGEQKIDSQTGGLVGPLGNYSHFGQALAAFGDLDGDGTRDLAVGAAWHTDGYAGAGAVWILFLRPDGTVRAEQRISATAGGFTGTLEHNDFFGGAVANIGDLDGDGVLDLAVGAFEDDDGGVNRGAVWILFLRADGTVKAHQKISQTDGGLTAVLPDHAKFGGAVAPLGDFDGDGVPDLAVGAFHRSQVYLLFLNADGTVKAHLKIASGEGGMPPILSNGDFFGCAVADIGDLNGDGISDLAVGARQDLGRGELYLLFLAVDGTVQSYAKIDAFTPGFLGQVEDGDNFGSSLACILPADGRDYAVLAVGARQDDDGDTNHGAVYVLHLDSSGGLYTYQKISETRGGFGGTLEAHDSFGASVALLGDLDGDTRDDLAVGAHLDDTGCVTLNCDMGAVWMLFTNRFDNARAIFRNGSGINAPCYVNVTPPLVGTVWESDIDTSGHPGAFLCMVLLYAGAGAGIMTPHGEVLVDPASELLHMAGALSTGTVAHVRETVPNDLSIVGISVAAQAVITGNGLELCNALDVVFGY